MKRKSSSTPDISDEEEYKDMSPVSVGELDQKLASIQIPKAEETIKGKSCATLFDPDEEITDFTFTEPKGVESTKGKPSPTFFGSEGKISDFTFVKPKEEPTVGKSSSTFFGPEGESPDMIFSDPKAVESSKGKSSSTFSGSGVKKTDPIFIEQKPVESLKGNSSSTFFGSDGKSLDFTLPEPIEAELTEEKSSSSSGRFYDVVLDFDDSQDNENGLILSDLMRTCLKNFEVFVSGPDIDVLEVGVTGKVFIPVFSKGFASNESCLRNLVSMVDCRSYSATNHITPIYFGVEPSDVRLSTPIYRQGLDKLRGRVEDKVVNRWTEALIDVSNISGQFIPDYAERAQITYYLMNKVCPMVLHKLKLSPLSKGTYLVGMNKHVESIIDRLNLGVNDVETIAITGREGAGKTTLARAVYDKLSSSFEGCSFLAGIKSKRRHWGYTIEKLQAKLVSDLLSKEVGVFQSVDEGKDVIRERLGHMKALIVLDDVRGVDLEDLEGTLHWLGPGSRIIFTTADTTFLWVLRYSVYGLSPYPLGADKEAYCLFNNHAFTKSYPVANFYILSKELPGAITRCRGFNPLAIEIVGSLLYGKSMEEWESMSLYLRQKYGEFFKDLNGMLRMTYDSLTENQREIFLDVACLPDGMDRRMAQVLWDDYSPHSQSFHDFEVLIRLSLVKIDAINGVWMHRLVRDFGKSIIKQSWLLPGLVGMGDMRFFRMTGVGSSNSAIHYARQRFFLWQSHFPNPLEADFDANCLKILDLSWSKITENWETWHHIQAPQLKVLNLMGCVDLMITPNFSFCPNLEMLILEHCSQLVKIDPSIQRLQRLVTLNLRYCTELGLLPKEIGCLTALKELLVDGTSIQEIPFLIGHLKKLQVLTAINCSSLTHLPSSTCNLVFITALKLDYAKIAELPCSILQRLKLQYLSLRDCRLITNLGSFVGEVERSLIELDISGTSITALPKSISKLKNLRVLKMEFCFIREFPPGFGELKKLEEVHASRCKRLESLPHDIGKVESLRILKVGHSRISGLPSSIQLLEHLEILDCNSCNKLQGLPELPSSLTSLYVQSKEFKELPDFHNLVNLKEFTLGNDAIIIRSISLRLPIGVADPLDWLRSSVHMRTLALCLPYTKKLPGFPPFLQKLTLQCTNLKQITSFPSTLVVISIQNLTWLEELPSVENLRELREMEVVRCPKIKKIEGLGRLSALKILTVSKCEMELLNGLNQLFSLRRLSLQDCWSLSRLPSVNKLGNLLEMEVIGCPKLKRITGLGGLEGLQALTISNSGISSLRGLDKLDSLRRLTITDCDSLHEVPDMSNLRNLNEKCVLLEDSE